MNFYLGEMGPDHDVSNKELKLIVKHWITNEILAKCYECDGLLKKYKNEKKLGYCKDKNW